MKKLLASLMTMALMAVPSSALAASLSISPISGTFNKGCAFSLDVVLDTAGADTDGTDAILIYDNSRFTATTVDTELSPKIYPDYPGNNIDDASGKVTISGLASVSTPFNGKGTLARVNFKVKDTAATGATQVKFDFDPNDKAKTTDSNVVQRSTVADVLNSVVNGNFTVGTGATCVAQGATGTTGSEATASGAVEVPLKKELPQAGSEQLTFTLAIVGSILTIFGILGLALL